MPATGPTEAEEDSAPEVQQTFREERFRLLFSQTPLHALISVLVASILVVGLWPVVSRTHAAIFLAAVFGISLLRAGLVVAFHRSGPEAGQDLQSWERVFALTMILAALVWGAGAWFLMPEEFGYRMMTLFFVLGIAVGASYYSTFQIGAQIITVLVILLPVVVDFALRNTITDRAVTIGAVVFLVAVVCFIRQSNHFLTRANTLSIQFQEAKNQAEALARTDFLSGLNNRRSFQSAGEYLFNLARRHGDPLSLVLFDIDHFKEINDGFGHAVGDAVIRALADCVRETCRESDIAGRLGGEEFAILLPYTKVDNAQELVDRLREAISSCTVDAEEFDQTFTASFGIAEIQPGYLSLEALIGAADAAMYQAKQTGRNRVVHAPAPD